MKTRAKSVLSLQVQQPTRPTWLWIWISIYSNPRFRCSSCQQIACMETYMDRSSVCSPRQDSPRPCTTPAICHPKPTLKTRLNQLRKPPTQSKTLRATARCRDWVKSVVKVKSTVRVVSRVLLRPLRHSIKLEKSRRLRWTNWTKSNYHRYDSTRIKTRSIVRP